MPTTPDKVLYTAHTHTISGRNGSGRSSDGALDVKLASPGSASQGTNPEQLFAVAWSACYMGAMGHAAKRRNLSLPADMSVDAEVDLGMAGDGYVLQARLTVSVPGLDRELVAALAQDAHQICPYSKATRGNIHVETHVA
jgi:Ohr subfamily peroxiredoxin